MSTEKPQDPSHALLVQHVAKTWSKYYEEVLFDGLVKEPSGKKNKPDTDHLLGVGRFRVWDIAVEKKPKLTREMHLYDIESLSYDADKNEVVLVPRNAAKSLGVLKFSGEAARDVVKAILTSYSKISNGFPEDFLKLEGSLPQFDRFNGDAAEKFLENYFGWCAYYSSSPSRELCFYISDLFARRAIDLDLSVCPAIESDPDDKQAFVDFVPLMAAMRYDSNFRSITLADVNLPQAVQVLAQVVASNSFLTKVVLSSTGASELQLAEFAELLARNQNHSIQILEISRHSTFQQRAATELGKAIASFKHVLAELVLSDLSMQPKALYAILKGLCDNPEMALSLNSLDLSGNKFDATASAELDHLFAMLKAHSKMHNLVLRGCTLSISSLNSLKHLVELRELDLSGNRLDGPSIETLCGVLNAAPSLTILGLAGCGLTFEGFKALVNSLKTSTKPLQLNIQLGENPDIGKDPVGSELVSILPKVVSLDLHGIRFKESAMLDLLCALSKSECLTELNLNDTAQKFSSPKTIIEALQGLVKCPTLTSLSLAGGFGRQILAPFLETMQQNTTLLSLDISNNELDNYGAGCISDFLVANKTLTTMCIDDNGIKLNGFLTLCSIFTANTTLGELKFVNDLQKQLSVLSGTARDQLVTVTDSIRLALLRNKRRDVTYWHPSSKRVLPRSLPTPTSVAQFSAVPAYLRRDAEPITPITASIGRVSSQELAPVPSLRSPRPSPSLSSPSSSQMASPAPLPRKPEPKPEAKTPDSPGNSLMPPPPALPPPMPPMPGATAPRPPIPVARPTRNPPPPKPAEEEEEHSEEEQPQPEQQQPAAEEEPQPEEAQPEAEAHEEEAQPEEEAEQPDTSSEAQQHDSAGEEEEGEPATAQ